MPKNTLGLWQVMLPCRFLTDFNIRTAEFDSHFSRTVDRICSKLFICCSTEFLGKKTLHVYRVLVYAKRWFISSFIDSACCVYWHHNMTYICFDCRIIRSCVRWNLNDQNELISWNMGFQTCQIMSWMFHHRIVASFQGLAHLMLA